MPTWNLTARFISSIKGTGKRQEYFDEKLPAFCLRVTPSGHKSWTLFYRHAGRLTRYTMGSYPALDLAEARRSARKALHVVAEGSNPAAAKMEARTAETFEGLATEYLERHAKQHKRSWRADQWYIEKRLLPHFGKVRAKEISRRDVRALLDRYAEKTPVLANRVRALLSKIFNWALANDIVEQNPVTQIPMPGKTTSRDRVLSEAEVKTLWKVLNAEGAGEKFHGKERAKSAAVLKMQLLTAQRVGEVMGMAWNELDLSAGMWTIPGERTKNGLSHRVPLSRPALRVIEETKPLSNDTYVFPSSKTQQPIVNLQKCIRRIQGKTEIDFHGHDLRRTAASMMTGMGIPRLVVSKILNHIEPGVTAVYDRHSYDKEKREALEAWGNHVMVLVSNLQVLQKSEA